MAMTAFSYGGPMTALNYGDPEPYVTSTVTSLAAFFYCLGPLQSGPVSYQAVLFLRPSDSLRVL